MIPPDSKDPTAPDFRAGLVALVGRTNVGKSTLVNALVETKLSIVSPKPQTTRHAIHGVVHRPDGQIVFVDTPGWFKTRRSSLVSRLHQRAKAALTDIDAILHVVDPSRPIGPEDEMVLAALASTQAPRVLCLNKSDLRRRPFRDAWLARQQAYTAVVEVSALARRQLDSLVNLLLPLLPVGPALYPPDECTNVHRDFRIAEIIREKIYLLTEAEVPYRTSVRLDRVEDRVDREGRTVAYLTASVLVAAERYRGMLIGAGARKIRAIGIAARRDLERLLGRQVYLDLSVRVDSKHETRE